MVTKCSESGSNPSSCVLHLPLHLMPLEPLVDAILMCSCTQGEKQLRLHHCASSNLTQERIANQTGDEDAVEKKDGDCAHDCTTDVVSARLDSCITRHTYLIGSLWRVLISSCESHRRCCGGENRREHRHLSTPTARSHPLPRQLLQSNIWAHPQQYSAQIARTKEPTRKTPVGRSLDYFRADFERRCEKVADLPIPSALTSGK